VSRYSPVADSESVVRLPARMRATILEALSGYGATVSELIAATASSAVHLEMRDAYTPDDQRFLDWLAGKPLPRPANPSWSELVRTHTARGVRFRRARVVSEPLADYIRFEHAITARLRGSVAVRDRRVP
jgi:hypothetical protein